MSWLGMFQVTKFRTWLSSDRYQKQKLLVNKGVFCGIDRFKETRLLVHQYSPSLLNVIQAGFSAGYFGVGRIWGCTEGVFFARKDDL